MGFPPYLFAGVVLIVRPPFMFGNADDEDSVAVTDRTQQFSAALIVTIGAVLQSNVFVLLRMLKGKLAFQLIICNISPQNISDVLPLH